MKIFPRYKRVRFLKVRRGFSFYVLDAQNNEGDVLHAKSQVTFGIIICREKSGKKLSRTVCFCVLAKGVQRIWRTKIAVESKDHLSIHWKKP
jgi:hypothetical protein